MRARLALLLAAAATALAASSAPTPLPSEPYRVLAEPQPVAADGKIEVLEFFWYGCEHCYRLEPAIEAWLQKKPGDVVFRRVPAIASTTWNVHAHLYYSLEAIGRAEDLHARIFEAIHKQGLRLELAPVRQKWLAAQDVDAARYAQAERSPVVYGKLKRAEELARTYRMDSVPMIVVHGKYVTGPHLAGSYENMFRVIGELVAQERKRQGGAPGP